MERRDSSASRYTDGVLPAGSRRKGVGTDTLQMMSRRDASRMHIALYASKSQCVIRIHGDDTGPHAAPMRIQSNGGVHPSLRKAGVPGRTNCEGPALKLQGHTHRKTMNGVLPAHTRSIPVRYVRVCLAHHLPTDHRPPVQIQAYDPSSVTEGDRVSSTCPSYHDAPRSVSSHCTYVTKHRGRAPDDPQTRNRRPPLSCKSPFSLPLH